MYRSRRNHDSGGEDGDERDKTPEGTGVCFTHNHYSKRLEDLEESARTHVSWVVLGILATIFGSLVGAVFWLQISLMREMSQMNMRFGEYVTENSFRAYKVEREQRLIYELDKKEDKHEGMLDYQNRGKK